MAIKGVLAANKCLLPDPHSRLPPECRYIHERGDLGSNCAKKGIFGIMGFMEVSCRH
ncbi:MAG: hypothetical protein CG446_145 [Methanosaeta sp. ASO1]|nr:MAG: hypothetical protein CG446_145 [Methanosaeta sp. ASO1]